MGIDLINHVLGAAAAILWLTAAAQTAAPAPNPPATRVVTLGTQGGPLPSRNRAQPANAVVVNGAIYLVDAGNGVLRQLTLAGLDYRRVSQIFITHNHDDHNADWGTLMGVQWSTGRRAPVQVFGPAGTEDMLQGFLRYFEPNARIRSADAKMAEAPRNLFRAKDVQPGGVVYQDANVKVSAAEVCHYHFRPDATGVTNDKALAFRFETADKVIVFSGDTGACGEALVAFAKGADILVHEVVSLPLVEASLRAFMASQPGARPPPGLLEDLMRHMADDHTVPEDIGRLATAAGVKKVVLSHFVPGRDDDPDSAYVDGVKKHFSGPVIAARDLMEF
jgi:ribonuclease BN (tRNA processing enzyme)